MKDLKKEIEDYIEDCKISDQRFVELNDDTPSEYMRGKHAAYDLILKYISDKSKVESRYSSKPVDSKYYLKFEKTDEHESPPLLTEREFKSGKQGFVLFDEKTNKLSFKEETFNLNEVRHLASSFAINSMKGSELSFDEWFNHISPKWKEIANRK